MNEHWSKTEIIPCRIQKAAKTEAYDCHAVHPIRERRPEPAAAHMDPEYASCQKLASKTVSLDADLLMKMVRGRMRREVSILRIETCLSILCCVEEQPSSKHLGPHCGITPESGRALSHDRCQLFYLACRLLDKGNAGLLVCQPVLCIREDLLRWLSIP